MKRFVLSILLIALASPAAAGPLPDTFAYTIYVRGADAGYSRSKVSYAGDAVTIETTTHLELEGYLLDCESKTVADAKTYLVRSFEWSGESGGKEIGGYVTVEGKSVSGDYRSGDFEQQSAREGRHDHILFLEDYVMSHEVLIARAHLAGGVAEVVYDLFQPSSFTMTSLGVVSASDIAFESSIKEAICRKLVLAIQGGSGFASYVDEKRGLPVYMAFPTSGTEAFLDEFFGDKPVSRYRSE